MNHPRFYYSTIRIGEPMYQRENLLNVAIHKHKDIIRTNDGFLIWIDAH